MEYTSLDSSPPPRSYRTLFWYHAFLLAFSVLLSATVVILFPAFHFAQWSLPTRYSLKETQQYVNFVVVAIALLISWLLSHCLSLTNDAEATAEFETKTFSLARLQTRSAAAGKDVIDLLRYASHNGKLWSVAGPFALSLTAFSAMAWVLSLLFVIEARLIPKDELTQVNITLGLDVPTMPDACRESLTAANCTYDLATSALASQLITHTPYTFDNVTFSGSAIGTQALPIGAMRDFANASAHSRFSSEKSQYCLPVLRPDLITCTPVTDSSRAKYVYINSRYDTFLEIFYDSYEVVINPDTPQNQSYVLVSSNGQGGVMAVAHSEIPDETAVSILTGSGQYADLLSRLATRTSIPFTKDKYNESIFTVICEQPSDDTTYSWQWIEFEMSGGVMTTNSTGEICRKNGPGKSPIAWLDYALEGATASASLRDGYSKLLNVDYLEQSGPDYERMQSYDMSPLEYILSHIVEIVNTAWTATNANISSSTPIDQRTFEHRYVVDVEIQGPTILALCVAVIILVCAMIQAARWIRAQRALHRLGKARQGSQWDLLDPLQLLAYGSMAAEGVSQLRLADEEKRYEMMKDNHGPTLGLGPGTLMPHVATTGYELPRYGNSPAVSPPRHARTTSTERLVSAANANEDLPDWDDIQSRRSVSPVRTPSGNGMRPLILRPGSSRSDVSR